MKAYIYKLTSNGQWLSGANVKGEITFTRNCIDAMFFKESDMEILKGMRDVTPGTIYSVEIGEPVQCDDVTLPGDASSNEGVSKLSLTSTSTMEAQNANDSMVDSNGQKFPYFALGASNMRYFGVLPGHFAVVKGSKLADCEYANGGDQITTTGEDFGCMLSMIEAASIDRVFANASNQHLPSCLLLSYLIELYSEKPLFWKDVVRSDAMTQFLNSFGLSECINPCLALDSVYEMEHWPSGKPKPFDMRSCLIMVDMKPYALLHFGHTAVWLDHYDGKTVHTIYISFSDFRELTSNSLSTHDWFYPMWGRLYFYLLNVIGIRTGEEKFTLAMSGLVPIDAVLLKNQYAGVDPVKCYRPSDVQRLISTTLRGEQSGSMFFSNV